MAIGSDPAARGAVVAPAAHAQRALVRAKTRETGPTVPIQHVSNAQAAPAPHAGDDA